MMFLGSISDKFPTQNRGANEERWTSAELHTHQQGRAYCGYNVKCYLDCSDPEMAESSIQRRGKTKTKIQKLDCRTADFGFFKDPFGRVPWDKALEAIGGQESYFILIIFFKLKRGIFKQRRSQAKMPGAQHRTKCF